MAADSGSSRGILLLGGTGFVGRHLMYRFQGTKRMVHIVSRKAHTLPDLDNVHRYSESLDNVALLNKILPKCSTVFHLASTSTPGSSAMQPAFEASNNLLPTLRFLETLQQHPNVQLVFLSTGGAIYGNPESSMVSENTKLSPVSYYGAGKAALEKFIIAFCVQLDRSAVILRPSNLYGPWQPYRPGFGVVPTIFNCLKNGRSFEIWGDGNIVRDYLYIEDFIGLCAELTNEPPGHCEVKIFNAGTQKGVTLNTLCELASEVASIPLKRVYRNSRAIDVRRIVLDCAAVHSEIGWKARTVLEAGLKKTWSWFVSDPQTKW